MATLEQSTNPISTPNVQLEPIAQPARGPMPNAEPNPSYSKFLVSSLPLSVIYQPDALRQFYRGGVPQSRIIPVQS